MVGHTSPLQCAQAAAEEQSFGHEVYCTRSAVMYHFRLAVRLYMSIQGV